MLATENKIHTAITRLKTFEPTEGYYLAFSGGKDSVVILALAKMAGVKFEAHHNITGLDEPELMYFMKNKVNGINYHMHETSMWRLIERKLMPPTRLVRYCCSELKEKGGEGRFVITGVRWSESSKRKNRSAIENNHKNKKYYIGVNDNDEGRMMLENCVKKGKFVLNPIIDWTDKEVWDFIKSYKLDYCSLYDKGCKRLGCIGCPLSSNQKKEIDSHPIYRKNYIKAFERMLIERKRKNKETLWENGEEVMTWWLNGGITKNKTIENQIKLEFEELI